MKPDHTNQSKLHKKLFKRTGESRNIWDLAKISDKSAVAITEIPVDIAEKMEFLAPMMMGMGLIQSVTPYAVAKYCIVSKMIALEMVMEGRREPAPELLKLTKPLRKRVTPVREMRKPQREAYPNKSTIPISTGIPVEIVKLAEKYAPRLKETGTISNATPYEMWQWCIVTTIVELEQRLTGNA